MYILQPGEQSSYTAGKKNPEIIPFSSFDMLVIRNLFTFQFTVCCKHK